ncbi:hypothetical protein HTZ77_30895 [Nonomuraea sp. SMC257]|uniref:S1 RNA-binding domain-containing protein n=1 Tax=Nonomuraea montanisoli TaxID=2741721 RepID=A0A7Y6ICZ6_9ACTN|nr:hypothetical protein [Nonomuraea montanisoli]NUW35796.1 hypothetical protein [Nonomuraea montanisoli]
MEDDQALAAFMATVNVGDTLAGTVADVTRSGATVLLDGFVATAVGVIGSLDHSWQSQGRRVLLSRSTP